MRPGPSSRWKPPPEPSAGKSPCPAPCGRSPGFWQAALHREAIGCRPVDPFGAQAPRARGCGGTVHQTGHTHPAQDAGRRPGEGPALRHGERAAGLRVGRGRAPAAGPQEALEHGALNRLLRERLSQLPGVVFHSPEDALPYVLNFSPQGLCGGTMLHFFAQRGVYVSSGSACGRAKPSHVLEAMGLPERRCRAPCGLAFPALVRRKM